MSLVVGIVFIVIGLALLSQSWRGSQGRIRRGSVGPVTIARKARVGPSTGVGSDDVRWVRAQEAAAIPLGVTAGGTALGGLAVLVSGWDTIGRIAALVTLVGLLVGLAVTLRTVRRPARVTEAG